MIIKKTVSGIRNTLLLSAILCFFAAANIVWIHLDTAPPSWSQADNLLHSELLYQILIEDGVSSFFRAFSEISETKAPLITVLPLPFYFVFGNNETSALYVNVLLIIISGYYLFRLGLLMAGRKEAVMGVFILNTFPLILGLSRQMYVDYALMVFVIVWMYYLMSSQGLTKRKNALILGVVLGLGMLMKISYPLYILIPTFYGVISEARRTSNYSKRLFVNIFIILAAGVMISSIWYYRNIMTAIDLAVMSAYGEFAAYYGNGAVFIIKSVLLYWLSIINNGLSAFYAFLIVTVLLFAIVHATRGNSQKKPDRVNPFLAAWFVVPFLVFTCAVNKELRYLAPLLPAVALFLGINLMKIPFRKHRSVMGAALLLFPAFNYLFLSFSPVSIQFEKGGFMIFSSRLGLAHPPVRQIWPQSEIVTYLHRDAVSTPNYNPVATLLFDHPHINFINMSYYGKTMGLNVQFNTNDFYTFENVDDAVRRIQEETDYLLTKSGDIGPEFANEKNIPVLQKLDKGLLDFRHLEKIDLPDGTVLNIYKKNTLPYRVYAGIEQVKERLVYRTGPVIFGGRMQLLDYRIKKVQEGYHGKFYWKCLREMKSNYKVFVHLYGEDDTLFQSADFHPTGDKYPTAFWREGEIIIDEVKISGDMPEDIRIFIGIYNEKTMDRLPVSGKPADAQENVRGVKIFEAA